MDLIIRTRDNTRVAQVPAVLSCKFQEKLSTAKTLTFETLLTDDLLRLHDNQNYVVEYGSEHYDVTSFKKSISSGKLVFSCSCEHVSYRLASIIQESRTIQGTPQEIVSAILLGSGFSCGTVEPTEPLTFATNGRTSSRAMILDFCQKNGYETEFRGYFVFIYNHRGATIPKELVDRNVVAISKTVDKAKGTRSYSCTLRSPTDIDIGDEVHFAFRSLGINEYVRVIGKTYDPFSSKEVSVEVDTETPGLETQFVRMETTAVKKDTAYYGVKIADEDGLTITRADGKGEIIINADRFVMRALDAAGQMQDKLYFNPQTGEYTFVGNIDVDGGEINIADRFRVDVNGNVYMQGNSVIYGGRYFAGRPGQETGYSEMTDTGFDVYNGDREVKLRLAYTTEDEDYPYLQLGSGSGASTDFGLVKKFSDGLWIGNAEPEDETGAFEAKTGYNGIFFRFSDNTAFVVRDRTMKNIYTGSSIARFG